MKKKTYMMPLVCVYAIETSTFLADSNGKPSTPPPVHSSGFSVEGGVTNGDGEDVWE